MVPEDVIPPLLFTRVPKYNFPIKIGTVNLPAVPAVFLVPYVLFHNGSETSSRYSIRVDIRVMIAIPTVCGFNTLL